MSSGVDEGSNGMSYDFGVQIAKGTIQGLVATVTGVIALTGAIVGLVQQSQEMDDMVNKNQIAFGGYANTLKAFEFAHHKQAEGIGFAAEDMLAGMKALNRAGLDAKKNFDLVSNAAKGSGKDFSEMAAIIKSGDFGSLADIGVITDAKATQMNSMGMSAKRSTAEIVKLLKTAEAKGMFKDAIPTMDGIMKRFKAFTHSFASSILGDPKDPEGLAFTVKKHLNQVADFIEHHINTITYWGKMVGLVLRTSFRALGDFVKMIAKNVFHLDRLHEKSKETMQNQLKSFGLWLEIQRVRLKVFFEEYGKYIGWIVKALLVYKALKIGSSLWSAAIKGAVHYFKVVKEGIGMKVQQFAAFGKGIGKVFHHLQMGALSIGQGLLDGLGKVVPMITAMRNGMMAFNVVALLNPIGLIVIAVVAVIAAVVALIAYWDELWEGTQDMGDAWAGLLGPIFLIIKYWEEIKATIFNMAIAIEGWFSSLKYKILGMWADVKKWFSDTIDSIGQWFSDIWTNISNKFHEMFDPLLDYLAEFFKPLTDAAKAAWAFLDEHLFTPISDFFSMIGDFIMDKIVHPIKDFIGGVSNFFGDMFGAGVDKSKEVATSSQDQANIDAAIAYQKGAITKEELDAQIQKSLLLKNATKSNADVQQIKVEKKATMEKERADKKAVESGEVGASEMTHSIDTKGIDFGKHTPNYPDMVAGKTTTNHNNVNINLGAGSNIDEKKLAAVLQKQLTDLGYTKQMREGH